MATLQALVTEVLGRAQASPAGREELRRFDHVFQFVPADGSPFYVRIRQGAVAVEAGDAGQLPYEEMETVRGETAILRRWFEGQDRLVDLGWDGKIQIPLYGPKMHTTAWLNRLVKLAHGRPIKAEV